VLIHPSIISKFFQIFPANILHIGAHRAEESPMYDSSKWGSSLVVWIESQKSLTDLISKTLNPKNNIVINCSAWSESGIKLTFHVASNSESSSFLEFETHKTSYPHITTLRNDTYVTQRVDEVLPKKFIPDLINVDVQGAEKHALIGCENILNATKYIYTEVNKKSLYKNCVLVDDLDKYLATHQFKRMVTKWYKKDGWGDALYINTDLVKITKVQILRFKLFSIYQDLFCRMKVFYSQIRIRITQIAYFLRFH
jgi:FkbM family methyltransferase